MRVTDLSERSLPVLTDYMLVSGNDNVDRKISVANLFPNVSKNTIFRGKNLGTITASNIDAFITEHGISTGIFTDIYVGDYFTISYAGENKIIRVAGFDIYYNTGDTALTSHHIVCVPDGHFGTAKMNSTHTTGVSENEENTSELSGFMGSDMFNITLPIVNANLANVFGGHLLTHREILTNSTDANAVCKGNPSWKGASNNWIWADVQAVLMSEAEVYGATVWQSSGYDTGITKSQLPLFALEPKMLNNRQSWFWLRDVANSTIFCSCHDDGGAGCSYAGDDSGVRPRFLIG